MFFDYFNYFVYFKALTLKLGGVYHYPSIRNGDRHRLHRVRIKNGACHHFYPILFGNGIIILVVIKF